MNDELYRYYVIDRVHRGLREAWGEDLAARYAAEGLTPEERMVRRFEEACRRQTPAMHPLEKIVLRRTVGKLPDVLTEAEWADIRKEHYVHELGYVSNLSPDYEKTIAAGLLERRKTANGAQKRMIDALIGLCDRYREAAEKEGRADVAAVLSQVPRYGARNFREALQFFRILHFALWLEGDYHNTVGRFDQYMYPYFKRDMEAGVYTRESALDLVEDFFLSFNKDSDLYVGVQQGDNGQSMVLGGRLPDGGEGFNELSELCLEASRNLKLIDPKINLRVSKKTPLSLFEKGTELTKVGLGFPQYSNDDVVIEGLKRLGYAEKDAVNYVVAACWEFIIPGVGDDIANIGAVNFPKLVDEVLRAYLPTGGDFEGLLDAVRAAIKAECERQMSAIRNVWFLPSPVMDLLRDGKKYQNFGLHGCGIASAADALAGVKEYVFDRKTVTPARLFAALDSDWQSDPELLHLLRYEAPKMGKNDDRADRMGAVILDAFADALEGKKNDRGGVFRPGTGSAMYYVWHAREIPASPDGRLRGQPFPANWAPSLDAPVTGPVSVVRSFTEPDLGAVCNGGPLTIEIHDSAFAMPDGVDKVAELVRFFVLRGGHQLQINAIDRATLLDAQAHPENHRHLIVRVWGWSGYFVELDREFQDQIIKRVELAAP